MKYEIIYSASSNDLVIKVNDAIEQGWRPIGGASSHIDEYEKHKNRDGDTKIGAIEVCFIQAMIKD